jgi:hypothetical protein
MDKCLSLEFLAGICWNFAKKCGYLSMLYGLGVDFYVEL